MLEAGDRRLTFFNAGWIHLAYTDESVRLKIGTSNLAAKHSRTHLREMDKKEYPGARDPSRPGRQCVPSRTGHCRRSAADPAEDHQGVTPGRDPFVYETRLESYGRW